MTGMTIGKLFAGIAIVSMMFAAIVMISAETNAEGSTITVTDVTRYHNAATAYSYFDITIDTSIDEVPDGTYPGWCVQLGVPIGSFPATATLYNTYDTTHPFQSYNWAGINWLINTYDSPDDFSYEVMEMALWGIMGDDYWINEWYDEDENTPKPSLPAETKDLVDDLIAGAGENDEYMPSTSDDVVLYIIYISATRQMTVIEVPYEPEDDDDECGARTIGYFKNHEEVWDDWVPSEKSPFIMFYNDGELDQAGLIDVLDGMGGEMWEKVVAQLLAAELNFAYFGPGTDWDFDYEECWEGISECIGDAYDFLGEYTWYNSQDGWYGPVDEDHNLLQKNSKAYKTYRSEGEDIKDCLDEFNNMGDEVFE